MTDFAKGVMLYSAHLKPDGSKLTIPAGIDFAVAVAVGDELKAEAGFNKHVQEAYDANIPCLALVKIDPRVYMRLFGLDQASFPAINDPYGKILDKLFLSPAGSLYAIHGIILDIRVDDITISGGWIAATAMHIKELCKDKYKVPVYLLTEEKVITQYPVATADPQVFLAGQRHLCTVDKNGQKNTAGKTVDDPLGSPAPNWNGIHFWWFGTQTFAFLNGAKTNLAPVWQYQNSIVNLHGALGYVPKITVPATDAPETDEEILKKIGFDVDYWNNRLNQIEIKVDEGLAILKRHFISN